MQKNILIYILILLSVKTFSQSSLAGLENKKAFDNFSGLPLSEKYGEVSSLKIVYDLKTGKLYYINSGYYKYHYEFCIKKLTSPVELEYFNQINYSNSPERRFLLANINYYKALGVYALEISPVDLMTGKDILFLANLVKKTSYIGERLHILLNSARLQDFKDEFRAQIPLLNPSDVYKNMTYQAVGKYKNCGTLHFIKDLKTEKDTIEPDDIIVIQETPLFLPDVAGIIVTEFQTPLSHLSILGQNRKIPVAAYKDAFRDTALLKFQNKKVCLDVAGDTFKIKLTDKLKPLKKPKNNIKLKYDLKTDTLVGIEYINKKSVKYAGNKAANFGILHKLSKKYDFKVPECAFVIPFYFYDRHIQHSPAKVLIDSLIRNRETINNDTLSLLLKEIRKAIKETPLDTVLVNAINKRTSGCVYKRFRFRSSTNAEDADGFSGAGLYASKTGVFGDEKKSFERAVKKVWASLWSYEAFSERDYFHIDHKDVYMGILVHRSFPNEDVNGVAVTKNLYRSDSYGFVINAQIGNNSVVKPDKGIVCDQFICYPDNADNIYKNKNTVDIITKSNLKEGHLVMSTEEIQNLANRADMIKKYFYEHSLNSKYYIDFGLDIEFKLDGKSRTLYIKQVRLFND